MPFNIVMLDGYAKNRHTVMEIEAFLTGLYHQGDESVLKRPKTAKEWIFMV